MGGALKVAGGWSAMAGLLRCPAAWAGCDASHALRCSILSGTGQCRTLQLACLLLSMFAAEQ